MVWANYDSFKRLICKNEGSEIKYTQNIAWFSQDKYLKKHNLGGFKEMSEWLKMNKPSKILFVQDTESSVLTSDLIKNFGKIENRFFKNIFKKAFMSSFKKDFIPKNKIKEILG